MVRVGAGAANGISGKKKVKDRLFKVGLSATCGAPHGATRSKETADFS